MKLIEINKPIASAVKANVINIVFIVSPFRSTGAMLPLDWLAGC